VSSNGNILLQERWTRDRARTLWSDPHPGVVSMVPDPARPPTRSAPLHATLMLNSALCFCDEGTHLQLAPKTKSKRENRATVPSKKKKKKTRREVRFSRRFISPFLFDKYHDDSLATQHTTNIRTPTLRTPWRRYKEEEEEEVEEEMLPLLTRRSSPRRIPRTPLRNGGRRS
jgi:hypothetical protein